MVAFTSFNAWQARSAEILAGSAAKPDQTKFRFLLLNNITVTRTTDLTTLKAAELPTANGYAREPITLAEGSYDTVQERYEKPTVTFDFTASGASLQASAIVLIADWGLGTEVPVAFLNFSPPITIGNGATQPITFSWNFLNTGNVNGV